MILKRILFSIVKLTHPYHTDNQQSVVLSCNTSRKISIKINSWKLSYNPKEQYDLVKKLHSTSDNMTLV